MQDLVVLMRAVNVGGRKLPMAELRALCAALGFADPQTYIQSGNLLLGTAEPPDEVRAALERAIAAEFGLEVPLVVRTAAQWRAIAAGNPFAGEAGVESRLLHLLLAGAQPPHGAVELLEARAAAGERVRIAGDALWIDYAGGAARSKLTPKLIDRAFGAPATARNLNTVLKLRDMLEARA